MWAHTHVLQVSICLLNSLAEATVLDDCQHHLNSNSIFLVNEKGRKSAHSTVLQYTEKLWPDSVFTWHVSIVCMISVLYPTTLQWGVSFLIPISSVSDLRLLGSEWLAQVTLYPGDSLGIYNLVCSVFLSNAHFSCTVTQNGCGCPWRTQINSVGWGPWAASMSVLKRLVPVLTRYCGGLDGNKQAPFKVSLSWIPLHLVHASVTFPAGLPQDGERRTLPTGPWVGKSRVCLLYCWLRPLTWESWESFICITGDSAKTFPARVK